MWPPHWSPDGKLLAYAQGNATSARVMVMDASTKLIKVVTDELRGAPLVGWLPDGRLEIADETAQLLDLDVGEQIEIAGIGHKWSLDGRRVAYREPALTPNVWIADANGHNAHQVTRSRVFAWSPNSKQLALLSFSKTNYTEDVRELEIADATTGSVKTLARASDLLKMVTNNLDQDCSFDNVAWSPDSSMLGVSLAWTDGSAIIVLDADTGAMRATWQWGWTRASFPAWTWSADNRHLAVWVNPDSMAEGDIGILDVQTGEHTNLAGRAFDWSPDGKWLAVTQDPSGLLITTPDLSVMHWLDTPNCFDVTWRPKR
jgi:Tol biopolymer transport system component